MARTSAAQRRARADLWLWAGALCVGAWGLLYPLPYGLCMSVQIGGAVAFLALPFVRPKRFPLLKKNGTLGTAAQIATIFVFILTIRSLLDFNLIDWSEPLAPAVAAGLLLAGLARAAGRHIDPPPRRANVHASMTGLLFMGLGLGWGATVEVNVLLDRSTLAIHRLTVERKWVSGGRYARDHLQLVPRIEALGGTDFRVEPHVWRRAAIGAAACVEERPGLLGIRWYQVTLCGEPGA